MFALSAVALSAAVPTKSYAFSASFRGARANAAPSGCPTPRALSASRHIVVRASASGSPEEPRRFDPDQESAGSTRIPATSAFRDMKAVVAGATGRTGRAIVARLVEEGVPVNAIVRDRSKAEKVLPMDSGLITLFEADVSQFETLRGAFEGVNTVFCATGASDISNPLGPFQVDYQGTLNLVALAKQGKTHRFVLVTSIGTDEVLNPLNLFWGILFWKKRAEEDLQRSGVPYTIVRPGGLRDEPKDDEDKSAVIMAKAGTYGLAPGAKRPEGAIMRKQVADVCVEASVDRAAANTVVEIITSKTAEKLTTPELFKALQ